MSSIVVARNPARPHIWVNLELEASDEALAEAFEEIPTSNNEGNNIRIEVASGNWPLFLHHLATRENLKEVFFRCFAPSPVAEIHSFLEATQQNNTIRVVSLDGFSDLSPTAISRFLHEADQLANFSLDSCIMVKDENDGAAVLAAAIQRHNNLRNLTFITEQGDYMVALLEALRTNKVIQKLTVSMNYWSNETYQIFQKLMRSTMTVRELAIRDPGQWTKQDLLEVAKNNFSLRTLTVGYGYAGEDLFFDEDDHRLLQSYFNRNERMEQFIETPASVPKHLFPETLGVAARVDNPSMLFESLKVVSTTELFGSNRQRTRKRKRPSYYKPY